MIPKEYIKVGNWFKRKGSAVATLCFTIIMEDGKACYENNFDNYAVCPEMIGKGRGVKEWVGGYTQTIEFFETTDEFEPQGDSPTYHEDYSKSIGLDSIPIITTDVTIPADDFTVWHGDGIEAYNKHMEGRCSNCGDYLENCDSSCFYRDEPPKQKSANELVIDAADEVLRVIMEKNNKS